jgi:hypothetical protein
MALVPEFSGNYSRFPSDEFPNPAACSARISSDVLSYRRWLHDAEDGGQIAVSASVDRLLRHRGDEAEKRQRRSWSAERSARLREMWFAGKPTADIAAAFSRTPALIRARAAKLGLPRRKLRQPTG